MPLNTQIIRNGEALKLRWGNFHIAAMALASMFDADYEGVIQGPEDVYQVDLRMFECYPDAAFPVTRQMAFVLTDYGALGKTPLNYGRYTLKGKHKFLDENDGEVLELLPGDMLHAYRD
jgi:hypothetical protein